MRVIFLFNLLMMLSLAVTAKADNMSVTANPYTPIIVRNIFSLVPMPTNPPPDVKPLDPPSKITPNGIMSLFGQLQVLFKVAQPAKPGKPAQDQSYVMSEGERQDDIEVTKIDEQAGMITFNNHGVIQELPLTAAPNLSTPAAPAPQFGGGGRGFIPPAGPLGFRGGLPREGQNPTAGNPSTGNNFSNPSSSAASLGYGAANNNGYNNSQSSESLSPEAQAILMEKSRIDTQDLVNQGQMPPLPPTAITPPEATGVGGQPLVTPPIPTSSE